MSATGSKIFPKSVCHLKNLARKPSTASETDAMANKINAKISSNEIYLVQSKSEKINHEGLQDILAAKENDAEFAFYVGPRLGTISPWSSKTEDIIRNVGFDNIERVERLYGFNLECDSEINALDLSMFYDRMTQSIYNNKDDFKNLFKSDKDTHSPTLCIVFPTNPNSKHGDIFLINLASDVPPVVDNFGLILVIFLIVF